MQNTFEYYFSVESRVKHMCEPKSCFNTDSWSDTKIHNFCWEITVNIKLSLSSISAILALSSKKSLSLQRNVHILEYSAISLHHTAEID